MTWTDVAILKDAEGQRDQRESDEYYNIHVHYDPWYTRNHTRRE